MRRKSLAKSLTLRTLLVDGTESEEIPSTAQCERNDALSGMETRMTLASTASGEETQAIPTPSVRCGKIKSTQIRDLCEDSMENEPNGGGETLESTVHCGKTPAWLSHLARGAMSGEETLMSTAFGEENSASTVGCTCDAKEEFVNCAASGEEKSASTAFGRGKTDKYRRLRMEWNH